jgi:hypothetical protein
MSTSFLTPKARAASVDTLGGPSLTSTAIAPIAAGETVGAFGGARLGKVHAVGGVVSSGARDDAGAIADGFQHRAQQGQLLVVGGGR